MSLSHQRARAAVLLVGLLTTGLLTGCGTIGTTPATSGLSTTTSAPAAHQVRTLNGDTVTLPVPGKTTVLHFFSLSCAQCIEGIQAVGKAQQAVAADYIAVAIDPGDEPEDITGMLCAAGSPQLTVARDTDATLLRTWRVTAPATTIVVDSTGKIAFRGVVPTAEELTEAIRGVTT